MPDPDLHELLYLDAPRTRALASQLFVAPAESPQQDVRALESALLAAGKLIDIPHTYDFSQWTRENFRDGQIIHLHGLIRILDIPWLASVMETLPRMLKVTQRAELSALKQKREAHQITQAEVDQKTKEHQAQLKDLETWKMDELTDVVRELYGQSVRVKIIPYGSKSGEILVGSCLPTLFLESPAILSQNYGTDINANWSITAIINTAPPAPVPLLPTGNAIEDMFERLALAVNRIHRTAGAPDFPALAITPLAIYRTL